MDDIFVDIINDTDTNFNNYLTSLRYYAVKYNYWSEWHVTNLAKIEIFSLKLFFDKLKPYLQLHANKYFYLSLFVRYGWDTVVSFLKKDQSMRFDPESLLYVFGSGKLVLPLDTQIKMITDSYSMFVKIKKDVNKPIKNREFILNQLRNLQILLYN